jgi:hypothetical protein
MKHENHEAFSDIVPPFLLAGLGHLHSYGAVFLMKPVHPLRCFPFLPAQAADKMLPGCA